MRNKMVERSMHCGTLCSPVHFPSRDPGRERAHQVPTEGIIQAQSGSGD